MSQTDGDVDVTVTIGNLERVLGVKFSEHAYLKVRDVLTRALPKPTLAEPAKPPTGNYLETATLRCAEAMELVAEAWRRAGNKYAALRLCNLARLAEEVAAEETARRRADKEMSRENA